MNDPMSDAMNKVLKNELADLAVQLLTLTEAGLYKILGNEAPDGVLRDVGAYFEGLRRTARS